MTLNNNRGRSGAWLLTSALALGCWSTAVLADEARPRADDKCVSQCDAQSDKCMLEAGKDSSKQKQCDSAYDECLRKCG
jgi:hypothetical protein